MPVPTLDPQATRSSVNIVHKSPSVPDHPNSRNALVAFIIFLFAHFDQAVNVTLGLPIIRTSPDHGTAFDIVGRNRANPGSMRAAIELAINLAVRRHRRNAKKAEETAAAPKMAPKAD